LIGSNLYSITANHISKVYKFYRKPVDRLKESIFRRPMHQPHVSLEDISFTLSAGESLGIIGENGAGKSTLLKILAGTLTPSSGDINIHGRVAALLELGSGFNPEFTGRQNIYLNAALLGLSQKEIKDKENDIIGFAELGIFIDRPLKTYSSGMVVRLAFSIATSVNPDILIIDEALSVGDQYFQKKCIDRMLRFREMGKTILFCSHDMYTVNLLCDSAIWLDKGGIREQGKTSQITADYENYLRQKENQEAESADNRPANEKQHFPLYIHSIALNNSLSPIEMHYNEDLRIRIEFESSFDGDYALAIGIKRNDGLVCHAVNLAKNYNYTLRGKGRKKIEVIYPNLPFLHGQYSVIAFLLDESGLHCYYKKESESFTIPPPESLQNEMGLLELKHDWKILS